MIEKAFIKQGIKNVQLWDYLRKELKSAGFTRLEIVKTPLVTRIVVNVTNPGLAIGKGGQNIRTLTKEIGEKFGIDNPQLEIKEIEKPQLDAQAMSDLLSSLIERGFSWRSVAFKIVRDIMNAGALGVEVIISGKLGGKGARKRKQRIALGYMKKAGEQTRLVDAGMKTSYPKQGAIGIKIKIIRPDVMFPDKINIREVIAKKRADEEKENAKIAESAEESAKAQPAEEPAAEKTAEKIGEIVKDGA